LSGAKIRVAQAGKLKSFDPALPFTCLADMDRMETENQLVANRVIAELGNLA
jgi:hypothetical protein